MGLNVAKGNMYEWVTHTWNTVKGECPHGCTYCYMKRWGKQSPMRFDEKELNADLGSGNFIFVGSSCDLFAKDVPEEWILKTLRKCYDYNTNQYLFQTKNPARVLEFNHHVFRQSVICTTLESDIFYPEIMGLSPSPLDRAIAMNKIAPFVRTYVTIEPIMDFHLESLVTMVQMCNPHQVNIGADSGANNLPEPSYHKVMALIEELNKFTTVVNKTNLNRLLK